jgi:hypothetical protein
VPVNVQSTLIVRFGHAVDVRSPRLDAPPVRLAELVPLGPVAASEASRDGVRYRVLERRFAVLPFASGDLSLTATVSGTTPAALPEAGGRTGFTLATPALRLTVSPATVSTGWLPAHDLQFSADNATPGILRVGEVWTRNLLIEAVGVDGGVITPPVWPATSDWSLQFDPPQVGRRVDGGRVIGYRRQTVHAQALKPGRQSFPVPRLGWWQVAAGQWRDSVPSEVSVEVEAPAANSASESGRRDQVSILESHQPDRSVPGKYAGWTGWWLASLALVVIAAGVLRWRPGHRALRLAWQRHRLWRALVLACRNNDAPAARRALQAWFAGCGLPARLIAADAIGHPASLAKALAALDTACFGPPGGGWNGQELRRALPALSRLRSRR